MSQVVTASPEPLRVLILGSCVSRDILNFATKDEVVLAEYFARSSIASIASTPYELDEAGYARIASDFQRRMVRYDLEKNFLHEVAGARGFDLILIDLIDERFDLFEVAPGAVVTVSSEFLATGAVRPEDRAGERWIKSGSERHRALWKAGIERLFSILAENDIVDRVVVNKVFWADRMEDGAPFPGQEAEQRQAANDLLAWMYQELDRRVPALGWLTFEDAMLTGSSNHRWGVAPFHYPDAYYRHALAQLKTLHTKMGQDGAILLDDGRLAAWAAREENAEHRVCFVVFRNDVAVYRQAYSSNRGARFDTGRKAGDYRVVVFTLSFDPARPPGDRIRRREATFRFLVDEPSRMDVA